MDPAVRIVLMLTMAHLLGEHMGGSLLWRVSGLAAFRTAETALWSEQESSVQQ